MHMRIHSIHGNSTPADLQCNWVSKACSVIPVLIQPVPAVSDEIGVKADNHLPIGCFFLSDPIKYSVESTLTAPWRKEKYVSKVLCQSISISFWICV